MKTRRHVIALATTAVLAGSAAAFAYSQTVAFAREEGTPRGRGRGGQGPGGPGQLRGLARALDLSEEQRQQMRELREGNGEAMKDASEAARQARQALRQAVEEGLDEFVIRERAAELGTAEGERAVAEARIFRQFQELLTEEQKQTMDELRESRAKGQHGRAEQRGPGRRHRR